MTCKSGRLPGRSNDNIDYKKNKITINNNNDDNNNNNNNNNKWDQIKKQK